MTRRGCLWFAGGLLLAGLAGVLAFVALLQASSAPKAATEEPKVQVLVAARDIPLQVAIAAADVTVREVSPDMVPEDYISDPEDAIGQIATTPIVRDEVILRRRLIKPDYVGPKAALVMDPTKVLVAFPSTDLLSQLDIVRPGDRVDMMFSFNSAQISPSAQQGLTTMMLLQDVKIAGIIRAAGEANKPESGAPRAFLLALDPQDALTLKYFRDNAGACDLALRSPTAAEGPWDVLTVDGDYIMQRFKLRRGSGG